MLALIEAVETGEGERKEKGASDSLGFQRSSSFEVVESLAR
jgi:hypothetical protein